MIRDRKLRIKKYHLSDYSGGRPDKQKIAQWLLENKKSLIAIFLIIAAVSLFYILSFHTQNTDVGEPKEGSVESGQTTLEKSDVAVEPELQTTANNRPAYLQEYIDINRNTVGYIRIENTDIDYPVVQTDNNEYYMTHDFYLVESNAGAISMDFRCDINDFSKTRNIIIYGHRMKDGSMFKDLTKYQDKDFFLENRIIKFDTKNGEYEWKIFAVLETTTDFYYIDTEFPYDTVWLAFLDEVKSHSIYETHTDFYPNDIVLTLSTCMTEEDGRLVVMAKLKQ